MISKKQLCELYKISLPTLNKRLKMIGMYDKKKRLYSPFEVLDILKMLGIPD